MREEWRTVPGYEAYEVSSLGHVKRGKRMLAARPNVPGGYHRVSVTQDKKRKHLYVHRLVAMAFIGEGSGEVDHIDGNKLNNRVDNLRWVTPSENKKHSFEFPRLPTGKKIPVRMITPNGVYEFGTMNAAARAVNRSRRAIYNACRDNTRCAGARWERA